MTHRKQPVPAGHMHALNVDTKDANVLQALATGGTRGTDGRPVYLNLTDAEIRGIIARLITHPRWCDAIETAARIGFPLGPQVSPGEREKYLRHLCERMAGTMTDTERVLS